MDELSMSYMNRNFLSLLHIYKLSKCCMDKKIVHTKCGQVFFMWHGQVVFICHIDKDMSDDTEQVHNESKDITYLRKRYMNIAPTGHIILFAERQNLPYSVLLGFIPPWNIVVTTQCSGWGSSSIFIKSRNSDNSYGKMICHKVFRI